MKLLRIEKNDVYEEIDVKSRFLFWESVTTYRKIGHTIFKYKYPNNYKEVGVWEAESLYSLFKIEKLD